MSTLPYRREGETWLIDLRLESVEQLASSLDPSPFASRDLDSDAEDYIIASARDLPGDSELALCLWLPADELLLINPERIRRTVHSHFEWKLQRSRHQLREHLRAANRATLLGLAFMMLCMLLRSIIEHLDTLYADFTVEGLMVIGWVALWRPVEMLLYDWWPLHREVQLMRRLARLAVNLHAHDSHEAHALARPPA